MQIQSKPTTVLLAIIALLLAANLIVNLPPQEAKAQSHLHTLAPHVIQVEALATATGRVFRLWSDGVIEGAKFDDLAACVLLDPPTGFAWQEIVETDPPPLARIVRLYIPDHSQEILLRLRSDGVVEQNRLGGGGVWCGWRTPPE